MSSHPRAVSAEKAQRNILFFNQEKTRGERHRLFLKLNKQSSLLLAILYLARPTNKPRGPRSRNFLNDLVRRNHDSKTAPSPVQVHHSPSEE